MAIRSPKHKNEIMIERGNFPHFERRYTHRRHADALKRQGWTIWCPLGSGWKQADQPLCDPMIFSHLGF